MKTNQVGKVTFAKWKNEAFEDVAVQADSNPDVMITLRWRAKRKGET